MSEQELPVEVDEAAVTRFVEDDDPESLIGEEIEADVDGKNEGVDG